ncbi:uncharacterized protein LOC103709624 isoform X2 [Phoenix dactylifera]|uniref:Uncharacterized protein LOC103709624 isoform X2 n=1 Tax=Phoenix dactylifera TaxID=42345 RepID=A0A8B9AKX6_PHODC|nr:uncharacterized protein LOC103709624 isoform X2 [Phoenix dactylifera]
MRSLTDTILLLSKLASNLRRSNASPTINDDDDEAISSLATSLNFGDRMTPRVRVLDPALSLMCFKTPEVCSSRIECLVRTIVSVLNSSISCKVLRPEEGGGAEFLKVGSSISSRDCHRLIRVCGDVLESLEGHGGHSQTLIYAILKAVVSSSSYQSLLPLSPLVYEENEGTPCDRRAAISKLMCFLPKGSPSSSHEIPMRLFLWYLDPPVLKHDISEILHEAIQRPFLCLRTELHDRMAWHTIIICLVISPTMFIEARALLHSWFLLTHHELLAIISGHISCNSFLDLVHYIKTRLAPLAKHSDPTASHPSHGIFGHEALVDLVDNDSAWTMLMDFPAWFYFATALIFHGNDSQDYISSVICGEVKTETVNNEELHQAATLYLSWILCPIDEANRRMLFDQIYELSRSWIMKNKKSCSYEQRSCSDIHYKSKLNCSKKLRIPKPNDCDKLHVTAQGDRASSIRLWLKKFDQCCVNYCTQTTNSHIPTEAKLKQDTSMYPNLLSAKIPLGIFITSLSDINEKDCELLLHYAASGEIKQVKEMQRKAKGCIGHDEFTPWSADDATKWALNGACLVFNLLDLIEDMSVMLFDCEDTRVDFLHQMKGKASRYLLKCVKLLFECECHEFYNGAIGVRDNVLDLYRRLVTWRQQGPEGFEGYKAFDDVVDDFAKRFRIVE